MPQSSVFGFVMRAPDAEFASTEPVSSWDAFITRDSLMHCADQFAQTRINWMCVDQEVDVEGIQGVADTSRIWAAAYPHSWLAPNKPANVLATVLGVGDVRVRLVPRFTGIGDMSAPAVFDAVLPLGVSPAFGVVTHQNDAGSVSVFESAWETPVTANGADGNPYPVRICMMRLEVSSAIDDDATFAVWGVHLREFA